MFWKKYKWHRAASKEEELILNKHGICVVEIEQKKICVAKSGSQWFAFAYHCPHAGGLMNEGYLDGAGNISCPVHGYKFSLKTGASKFPEGYCIKTFKIELKPDGVYIGL
ncbi:MAG: Rieske 2Fe-2S domain-containing protein [Bacteroidetes bacterium]|nr:Rieske 2Fe-2S domain-containing protein [Bacteroidota bacterium]MBS1973460.1 Rieske 2Fe-2S domain-containing protein [Bacteroidota bacterium]